MPSAPHGFPLFVLTCGRKSYVTEAITSALDLHGPNGLVPGVIVDDSGDPEYRLWLDETYSRFGFRVHPVAEKNAGFTKAMITLWGLAGEMARELRSSPFILEEDFVSIREVDLDLVEYVIENRSLWQMVLPRDPWFEAEKAAGSVIEYHEMKGQVFSRQEEPVTGAVWQEHRAFWSNNPCLINRQALQIGWPQKKWSESAMGRIMFSDRDVRVGLWGERDEPPLVDHIGAEKMGFGW